MSGRPCGGFQRPPLPVARAALRSSASANCSLCGPRSAAPLPKRLTASTPPAMNTSPSPALDGVRRHADGLQRRRAVAVDGDARHVEPGEDAGHAPDVGARFAGRLRAAPDDVLDELAVEPGLAEHSLMMNADMSSGRTSMNEPLAGRPIGVRAVLTMTASGAGIGRLLGPGVGRREAIAAASRVRRSRCRVRTGAACRRARR